MIAPLDDLYLEWLYSQVASVEQKAKSRTYWSLARQLYTKEFIWLVPNDDNRCEDGRDLRWEFIRECNIHDAEASWMRLGCCMFELLIGLSKRLSFEAEREPRDWFWEMLHNIKLDQCTDLKYNRQPVIESYVDGVLDTIIFRTYEPDGTGGLFPLRYPQEDQRDVELWYQLCAYLLENN